MGAYATLRAVAYIRLRSAALTAIIQTNMNPFDSSDKPAKALVPAYKCEKPNEPVPLYIGRIRATDGTTEAEGTGSISFVWHPHQRVAVELKIQGHFNGSMSQARFDLLDHPSKPGVFGEINYYEDRHSDVKVSTTIYGVLPPCSFIDNNVRKIDSPAVSSVFFHIANLSQLNASQTITNGETIWKGRTVSEVDGWRITVDRLSNFSRIKERLRAYGGFGITHVGVISQADNKPYSVNDAHNLLYSISFYMSYLRGDWTSIVLPIGYGQDGREVYRDWVAGGRLTSWQEVETSSAHLDLGTAERGLAQFLRLSEDPVWKRPLMSAIRWYVEANSKAADLEGAIILQMTAFELLAWTLFVHVHKHFSEKKYNNSRDYPLSAKLHHLLDWIKSPTSINKHTHPHLYEFAKTKKMERDSPQVLCGIRNAYVHPNRQRRDFIEGAANAVIQDAYKLNQKYLRELLGQLFGYAPIRIHVIEPEF